jgi:hypothetical protein
MKQDILSLLNNPELIRELFFDYELHLLDSFYVIDPITKEYQTNRIQDSLLENMVFIDKAYVDGKTIVIKNLEKFIDLNSEFGPNIDIHAYIVPGSIESGDSFDWHTDDRSVYIKMLWGSKIFALRYQANETVMENYIKLDSSSKFFIPKGQYHKASPMGASCLLSIGLPDSNPKEA